MSGWRVWLLVAVTLACTRTEWQARFVPPGRDAEIDRDAPFLKAHTFSGHVYVLERWRVDDGARAFRGRGRHYDADRNLVDEGPQAVPFDLVALVETNRPQEVSDTGVAMMGVLTGASLLVTTACLSAPKACFGSCPTFWVPDGEGRRLAAEGFSEAVGRAFERTDVDALWDARPESRSLVVEMTNEALETHAVRGVRVLAARRPEGGRVVRVGETYRTALTLHPPTSCAAPSGDCLDAVRSADDGEYRSTSDPEDLGSRETIELVLPRGEGPAALVIGARNSLVNTFILYQLLAWMGRDAGRFLVGLERAAPSVRQRLLDEGWRLLGGIRVSVETASGEFREVGEFFEVGPIAREVQAVALPDDLDANRVRVRLDLTRGYWKVDLLALADLGPPVEPVVLEPTFVARDERPDEEALALLRDPDRYLVTQPGDAFDIGFDLPEGDSELFLEARGHYWEWMRTEWLAEENPVALARFLLDPAAGLRRLAPVWARIEPEAETAFWRSRIGRRP